MPLIEDCAGLAGPEPQTWGTGLMNNTIFAGLDVHKEKIAVAVAEGGRGGEVRQLGNFLNRTARRSLAFKDSMALVTGMRVAGTEVLAAGEEPAAYGATIRDGGAGSTKVWAGRCIR
jgi:hypothetical protein